MLIRCLLDGTFQCASQEHHGIQSGQLAGAWSPTRLDPMLLAVITMHDTAWRQFDLALTLDAETALPHDFLTIPTSQKIAMYQRGIDELENVHPYVAWLISRHYSSFSGTRDLDGFVSSEADRRLRLLSALPHHAEAGLENDLRWLRYFDVFSLYLCMAGPDAAPDSVPRWLQPETWRTAPDGTELQVRWQSDAVVVVEPWPFTEPVLHVDVQYRPLVGRLGHDELADWQRSTPLVRPLRLARA